MPSKSRWLLGPAGRTSQPWGPPCSPDPQALAEALGREFTRKLTGVSWSRHSLPATGPSGQLAGPQAPAGGGAQSFCGTEGRQSCGDWTDGCVGPLLPPQHPEAATTPGNRLTSVECWALRAEVPGTWPSEGRPGFAGLPRGVCRDSLCQWGTDCPPRPGTHDPPLSLVGACARMPITGPSPLEAGCWLSCIPPTSTGIREVTDPETESAKGGSGVSWRVFWARGQRFPILRGSHLRFSASRPNTPPLRASVCVFFCFQ